MTFTLGSKYGCTCSLSICFPYCSSIHVTAEVAGAEAAAPGAGVAVAGAGAAEAVVGAVVAVARAAAVVAWR